MCFWLFHEWCDPVRIDSYISERVRAPSRGPVPELENTAIYSSSTICSQYSNTGTHGVSGHRPLQICPVRKDATLVPFSSTQHTVIYGRGDKLVKIGRHHKSQVAKITKIAATVNNDHFLWQDSSRQLCDTCFEKNGGARGSLLLIHFFLL